MFTLSTSWSVASPLKVRLEPAPTTISEPEGKSSVDDCTDTTQHNTTERRFVEIYDKPARCFYGILGEVPQCARAFDDDARKWFNRIQPRGAVCGVYNTAMHKNKACNRAFTMGYYRKS